MKRHSHFRFSSILAGGIFLAAILACSNPLSRYTKQYKCQVAGKPDPHSAYEFVERGMEHVRAEEFDCALGACSEAIRLDSKSATAYACRGAVLANKGDYLKGLADLDYALKLQPENGDIYHSRAQVQDKLGETDKAIADSTKAIEFISSEFGKSVAFAFRAGLYQKQGKLDQAIKDYGEAIRLAPDFAYHFAHRGRAYAEAKEFNKAIADYNEAIKLDPKSPYFLRDRADAYRKLSKLDLARQDELAAGSLEGKSSTAPEDTITTASNSTIEVKDPIAEGELAERVVELTKPSYAAIGKSVRALGLVVIQVTVDENGKVVFASGVSGHPLLTAACVAAARGSRFQPGGKISGTISYKFEVK